MNSTFAIVIDENSDEILRHTYKALLRIGSMENHKPMFLAPNDEVGVKFSKITEYWARREQQTEDVLPFYLIEGEPRKQIPQGPPTLIVTVSKPGVTYADLLKQIMKDFCDELTEDILSVKKGKVGNSMELRVVDFPQKREEVIKRIGAKVENSVVGEGSQDARSSSFYLNDLDLDSTIQEIQIAIQKEIGKNIPVKVSALRPAFRRTQKATFPL